MYANGLTISFRRSGHYVLGLEAGHVLLGLIPTLARKVSRTNTATKPASRSFHQSPKPSAPPNVDAALASDAKTSRVCASPHATTSEEADNFQNPQRFEPSSAALNGAWEYKIAIDSAVFTEVLDKDPLNPPTASRPPPLNLPPSQDFEKRWRYWLACGKAYLGFYKTGVKQIWGQHKALRRVNLRNILPKPQNTPLSTHDFRDPTAVIYPRSLVLALARKRTNNVKIVPFLLLLIVCGEWTPFIALIFPRIVPPTCWIPRQWEKKYKSDEDRRRSLLKFVKEQPGFDRIRDTQTLAEWDSLDRAMLSARLNILGRPAMTLSETIWPQLHSRLIHRKVTWLEWDDNAIKICGGWSRLNFEELKFAAAERGLDVLGKTEDDLRKGLRDWLEHGGWRSILTGKKYFDLPE